jgi:hypothetical protein
MEMARLWKLDLSENVMEIEKYYEFEKPDTLPLSLKGRILEEKEII